MDRKLKAKIVARTTYHGRDGRFSSPMSAVFASRDGERLKVVRQLRRLTRRKVASSPRDKAMETVLRANLGKAKAALLGELSAPGFINVGEVLFQGR